VAIKDGAKMRGKGTQVVRPGERLVVMTPGGGGLGAADARDPALLASDVREERT
jgi:N-methylhydantoinase B